MGCQPERITLARTNECETTDQSLLLTIYEFYWLRRQGPNPNGHQDCITEITSGHRGQEPGHSSKPTDTYDADSTPRRLKRNSCPRSNILALVFVTPSPVFFQPMPPPAQQMRDTLRLAWRTPLLAKTRFGMPESQLGRVSCAAGNLTGDCWVPWFASSWPESG